MTTPEVRNARITHADLGTEDHGILSSMLRWEADSCGGGFGGLHLGGPCLGIWVRQVLDLFDYSDWSQLKGTLVRVRTEGVGGRTLAIGHIIKDKWLSMDELQSMMRTAVDE